ncbi:MAG: hypothetical protein ABIP51_16525 [Bacteroidia bacterium]
MSKKRELSLIKGNSFELHYWFDDNSHTMDAIVENRCDHEILSLIKEISNALHYEIIIETEPITNGGLRRLLKIALKIENKKATIVSAIILALLSGIIITPITTSISEVTKKIIEKAFEDSEFKELAKEKLRLEVKKLKQETDAFIQKVDSNNVIKKRRSNFYETLQSYPKVQEVSFTIQNDDGQNINEPKIVKRKKFKSFILVSDELEPTEIDNATIEIISPVLKKGKFRWMGIYNSEPIPFNMQSKEFKTLIQSGKIEFKNGSSIDCFLKIKKKIDNEGNEKIIGYDVERVNKYFENDKPVETFEGKFHRHKLEGDKKQLKMNIPDELSEAKKAKKK